LRLETERVGEVDTTVANNAAFAKGCVDDRVVGT
jgi:hypothetical protein